MKLKWRPAPLASAALTQENPAELSLFGNGRFMFRKLSAYADICL
ncbi:hypothetical protein [Achromobacter sp. UBA2119]|nr:hypothetical protein [Achromobacter sp. UBA2119]